MAAISITPEIARHLVKTTFGSDFEFELVGSLVTSNDPAAARDIDFIIKQEDFGNLKFLFPWEESLYFEGSGYKFSKDGVTYNAVVLSVSDYCRWRWAVEKLVFAPSILKPTDKTTRIEIFEWLLTCAPTVSF